MQIKSSDLTLTVEERIYTNLCFDGRQKYNKVYRQNRVTPQALISV